MPTYLVRVRRKVVYEATLRVDAESRYKAEQAAEATYRTECQDLGSGPPVHEDYDADTLTQEGEPWVGGRDPDNGQWRPDGYMDTKDLLLFHRAYGHRFTDGEVLLLKARAEAAIGPVAEHWNGAGYGALSIRMAGPFGELTDAQVAALMAPRPEGP